MIGRGLARWRDRAERWMLRGRTAEPLPIALPQRRIYVLPTGAGLALGATLAAMLIASLNYSLSLGFVLTFLLAGAGHVALLGAHRNLLGLRLESGHAEAVFAGETAVCGLTFHEASGRPRYALTIRRGSTEATLDLEPRGRAQVALACPTHTRGRMPLGRIHIETRWPLGWVRAWSVLDPALSITVFPRPEAHPPPPPGRLAGAEGARRNTRDGGDVFDSLRGYQPGDPLKLIAWRRLARGGPPASKVFTAEQGGEWVLRWRDCPAGLDTEARLSRLCAWVLAADAAQQRWALELPGKTIGPGQGVAQRHRALEALALYGGAP